VYSAKPIKNLFNNEARRIAIAKVIWFFEKSKHGLKKGDYDEEFGRK
jgi:hypothetical protein